MKNKAVTVFVVTWNINAYKPNNIMTNDFVGLFDIKG
jgi:hypothetical protein